MLSRVAENMYWLSRYLERAEHTSRALNLTLNLLLEQRTDDARQWMMRHLMESLFANQLPDDATLYDMTHALAFDKENSASITHCIGRARENARQIREQISSEMWEHLNTMFHRVNQATLDSIWASQSTHGFFSGITQGAQLFQGITDSTMSHNEGWYFLQLGRYLERAIYNAHFLDVQFRVLQLSPDYPAIAKDFMKWVGLLKSFTAFESYCKVYSADLRSEQVIEFLLLNAEFPHSIRFSIDNAEQALKAIDRFTETKRAAPVTRLIGKLRSDLTFAQIDEVMESTGLSIYLNQLQVECGKVHDAVNRIYISYSVDKALEY
jgi:uncharacterized alpha-E superfamily protein